MLFRSMFQCIVKPREVVSAYGRCHIQLSSDEKTEMEKQVIPDDAAVAVVETKLMDTPKAVVTASTVSTFAEDSDQEDEAAAPPVPSPEVVAEAAAAVVAGTGEATVAPLFKKVVKKVAAPVEEAAPPVEEAAAPVKKVVKKVVKKA